MCAVSLCFARPLVSYVQQEQGPYRVSRMTRSALRWAALCEDVFNFSKSTVEVLKFSATALATASLLFLIPRIRKTILRIWNGVDDRGIESTYLDYVFVVGDVSKVSMLVFYKIPPIRLAANGANLCIYGNRLHSLGNRYMDVSLRGDREDDGYLTLEIARTIACIAYSALRFLSVLMGVSVLADAAFLSLMCLKQFMHFGSHYYQEIYNPVIPHS